MFRIFSLVSLFLKYSFVSCVFWSEKVDKLQKKQAGIKLFTKF